ncbi:MAG: hypothetical protein B7Y58_02385 [Halothiobacillus sp. 35-54-62]|nr:MAG: hypothetical protein B7Y58_02385 [Halothiobacillus sp. 35-54-62]
MAMDISFALDNFAHEATRQKNEQAREAALNRLEKVTSHVPGLVYEFRLNPDGSSCFPFASQGATRIYHVNPRDIEHDASAVYQRIHPDDLAGVTASIQKSATALSPWRHEYRVLNPWGKPYPSASPMAPPFGRGLLPIFLNKKKPKPESRI